MNAWYKLLNEQYVKSLHVGKWVLKDVNDFHMVIILVREERRHPAGVKSEIFKRLMLS